MCAAHNTFISRAFARRIADATVEDCGNSIFSNIEKNHQDKPHGILLSPFENSGSHGKLGQLGIPIIECADYMETSPTGRAEWMKFYGLLYGREREASDMFSRTESEYKELCSLTDSVSFRPRVLVDRLYGQAWNVPAAESTMGIFIENAGGKNPFDNNKGSGSVGLNAEKVFASGRRRRHLDCALFADIRQDPQRDSPPTTRSIPVSKP